MDYIDRERDCFLTDKVKSSLASWSCILFVLESLERKMSGEVTWLFLFSGIIILGQLILSLTNVWQVAFHCYFFPECLIRLNCVVITVFVECFNP